MATWHGKAKRNNTSHAKSKRFGKQKSSGTGQNKLRNKTPRYVNPDAPPAVQRFTQP